MTDTDQNLDDNVTRAALAEILKDNDLSQKIVANDYNVYKRGGDGIRPGVIGRKTIAERVRPIILRHQYIQ